MLGMSLFSPYYMLDVPLVSGYDNDGQATVVVLGLT